MAAKIKWKIGDKAKVVGGYGNYHSIPLGTIITIKVKSNDGQNWVADEWNQNLMPNHMQHVSQTKADFEEILKGLKAEVDDIESKLQWMTETGSETFDEDELKCWKALKVVNGAKSDFEKAKALAALLRG